jgi:steroid delta-isomerase-like uncharacterized protein
MLSPRALIESYVAAFNAGDIDAVVGLHTSDAVIHGVFGWGSVREVAAPVWRDLHACLEMKLTIEGLVVEGSTVAVRYTERGRSVADFRGRPATGRVYELVAMEWYEIADGLIARRWGARDSTAQAKQLGWE